MLFLEQMRVQELPQTLHLSSNDYVKYNINYRSYKLHIAVNRKTRHTVIDN